MPSPAEPIELLLLGGLVFSLFQSPANVHFVCYHEPIISRRNQLFKTPGIPDQKRHARPGTDEARPPPQLGKVEWDTSKIGQAAKFAPGSYFEAQHSSALDLGIFTHYGLGQVA